MKQIILIFAVLTLSGCMMNYPMTTFYVKNDTDKTLNFKASLMKYSSMGQFEMTLPFSVPPHDSVIARKVGFRKDLAPTAWFKSFIIFPTNNFIFNDPNKDANWIKSTDAKGKTIYLFNMTR